jgi:hypothetical protein
MKFSHIYIYIDTHTCVHMYDICMSIVVYAKVFIINFYWHPAKYMSSVLLKSTHYALPSY